MEEKPKRIRKRASTAEKPKPASDLAKIIAGVPLKSRSKALSALRARLSERPDTEAMWKTIWDYDLRRPSAENNDRGLVLVLGAILERALEIGLMTHFVFMTPTEETNFFGPPDGTPMTFDVKIRLGHALCLYGQRSFSDLILIKNVRNLFAHARSDMTFLSTEVIDVCDHIQWIEVMSWGGIAGKKPTDARRKYIETVRHFYVYLATPPKSGEPLKYSAYTIPILYS